MDLIIVEFNIWSVIVEDIVELDDKYIVPGDVDTEVIIAVEVEAASIVEVKVVMVDLIVLLIVWSFIDDDDLDKVDVVVDT